MREGKAFKSAWWPAQPPTDTGGVKGRQSKVSSHPV